MKTAQVTPAQVIANRMTATLDLAECRTAESAAMIGQAEQWVASEKSANKALAAYWETHLAAAAIVSAGPLRYIANMEIEN